VLFFFSLSFAFLPSLVIGFGVPLSDCEVRDPRIRRTREALQKGLRALMRSRSFEDLSVQEIADAASVNRATFYDHYTDKFDLLEAMVAGGFHQLLHERGVTYEGTCATAAKPIILAVCDYMAQNHTACGPSAEYTGLEPQIDAAVVATIRRVLLGGLAHQPVGPVPSAEMIATASAGAIFGAVKEWLRTPDRPSSAEIANVILPLVMPVLVAGRVHTAPPELDAPLPSHD